MYTDTTSLILLSLLTGVPTLYFLIWGVGSGQFDQSDDVADSIFDETELESYRPWEKLAQQQERMQRTGTERLQLDQHWEPWL